MLPIAHNDMDYRYLTLTRVVFELAFCAISPCFRFHLTLTRVVFEFFTFPVPSQPTTI